MQTADSNQSFSEILKSRAKALGLTVVDHPFKEPEDILGYPYVDDSGPEPVAVFDAPAFKRAYKAEFSRTLSALLAAAPKAPEQGEQFCFLAKPEPARFALPEEVTARLDAIL